MNFRSRILSKNRYFLTSGFPDNMPWEEQAFLESRSSLCCSLLAAGMLQDDSESSDRAFRMADGV